MDGGSDFYSGALRQWLAQTTRVPLDYDSLIAHRDTAPAADITPDSWLPELWAVRFSAHLYYTAVVLRSFREQATEIIKQLSTVDEDANNPIRHLADARTQLSIDAAIATAAIDTYSSETVWLFTGRTHNADGS